MTYDPHTQLRLLCRPRLSGAMWEIFPDAFMLFRSVRERDRIVDFEWVYTNPAASKVLGRAHHELIGRLLTVEMRREVESGLFDHYRRVVETGEAHTYEFDVPQGGSDRAFRAVAAKVEDGFALWFTDVTARRAAELQLAAQAAHMTDLVETIAGLRDELRDAKRSSTRRRTRSRTLPPTAAADGAGSRRARA